MEYRHQKQQLDSCQRLKNSQEVKEVLNIATASPSAMELLQNIAGALHHLICMVSCTDSQNEPTC